MHNSLHSILLLPSVAVLMFGFVHGLPGNSGFAPGAGALAKREDTEVPTGDAAADVAGEAIAIIFCILLCLV
jgi:hypothetical protein